MGFGKQLHKSPIPISTHSAAENKKRARRSNSHSSDMAGPSVVSASIQNGNRYSYSSEQLLPPIHPGQVLQTRTVPKAGLDSCSLEGLWRQSLSVDWPSEAITYIRASLADSTVAQYDHYIRLFEAYCLKGAIEFPPRHPGHIAGFLVEICAKSARPEGLIRSVSAALGHVYEITGHDRPDHHPLLTRLKQGIVKGFSSAPCNKPNLIPMHEVTKLFGSWGNNKDMDISKLRAKAIALLALAGMFRPSDLAPKGTPHKFLPLDCVDIAEDASKITIKLFGIKNDTDRKGFTVTIVKASNPLLDPVDTLRKYRRNIEI
jgi:hypothetical protein